MKNFISKLRSRLKKTATNTDSNKGSGLVLVIVAVAFIGILVGSLLTAVSYAYRLKLYDYNAKDNFYYLEQGMDEVYAGVGNQTLAFMQEAYSEVINDMVMYSPESRNYITKDSETLNKNFKKSFLLRVANSPLFQTGGTTGTVDLDSFLRSFITNSDVQLVSNRATVEKYKYDTDGVTEVKASSSDTDFSSIIIKNVTLTRTAKYNRSTANGDFTQTISTDIVISQPDFTMDFNSINTNYSTLFDYCMIADNGIEITQNKSELSLSGNIYAAADFYNKGYNNYKGAETLPAVFNSGYQYPKNTTGSKGNYFGQGVTATGEKKSLSATDKISSADYPSVVNGLNETFNSFNNGVVCSKPSSGLRNTKFYTLDREVKAYDGVNENSRYSGLFIKGNNVNVNMQSSELIVPGTIAVMDGARLSLYGKTGMEVDESDVWADNIVLGGIGSVTNYPNVLIRGNLHVRDDLEMNANYSNFQLVGRYYGFGNSTKSDAREYVPSVDTKAFFYTTFDDQGRVVVENGVPVLNPRGHYNSSSIVVNGQQSKLDLSETNALFLAGRAYVELSKEYGNTSRLRAVENEDHSESVVVETDEDGNPITEKTFVFDGTTDDFRTGESVSLKTNQLAYVPVNITGTSTSTVEEVNDTEGNRYYLVGLPKEVQESVPFMNILGAGYKLEKVPCIRYQTTDGVEYYYDFNNIYRLNYTNKNIDTISFSYNFQESETASLRLVPVTNLKIGSAEELAKQFIIFYLTEVQNYASTAKASLKDISSEFDGFNFDQGVIAVPNQTTKIYSNGAITAKSGSTFTVTAEENVMNAISEADALTNQDSELSKMLEAAAAGNTTEQNVALTADDLEKRYAYVKWALENHNSLLAQSEQEMSYVQDVIKNYGEQYLTPINRYLNFNQIAATTNIHPALSGLSTGTTFSLQSGYSVWISNQDVTVSTDREDGVVQGIVITKGNVFFDNTVSKFEGLIVCGDKIFVDNFPAANLPAYRSGATGDRIITGISASPEVVRAILNECMMMTGESGTDGTLAKLILNLFKSHEKFAYLPSAYKTIDVSYKTIDTIRYSDVVRYNNWMKNVTDVSPLVTSTAGGGTTGGGTTGGGTTGGGTTGGGTTGGGTTGGDTSGGGGDN